MKATGIERFDLAAIPASPWKNGAGLTREIATGSPDAASVSAGFDWRISVAEVGRDAPFSAFPGIDRCIVLLSGAGMRLLASDPAIEFRLDQALVPLHFSGDLALQAALIDGPCQDFNVMTRRGRWRSAVTRHDAAVTVAGDAPGLLLCCRGQWLLGRPGNDSLALLQGVLWREPIGALALRPQPAGVLLQVRLCQDSGR